MHETALFTIAPMAKVDIFGMSAISSRDDFESHFGENSAFAHSSTKSSASSNVATVPSGLVKWNLLSAATCVSGLMRLNESSKEGVEAHVGILESIFAHVVPVIAEHNFGRGIDLSQLVVGYMVGDHVFGVDQAVPVGAVDGQVKIGRE